MILPNIFLVENYMKFKNTNVVYFSEHSPMSEFNEFGPRLKSAKNRFQVNTGLNLEALKTILNGTIHNS